MTSFINLRQSSSTMESSPNSPLSAQRSASYSKLNDWNGANSRGGVMTARRSRLARWKTLFVIVAVVACIAVVGLSIGYGVSKVGRRNRTPKMEIGGGASATFGRAAVVSQSTICAEIGRDVLVEGGSAVDAAIAAMTCEDAYSSSSVSIGGGFFMLVFRNDTKHMEVIDGRETAPLKATVDMYANDPKSAKDGPLSVAVPGELRGYWLAHQRHGKLNWSRLLEPTIELCADKGIVVSKHVAYMINEKAADKILNTPSMSTLFVNNATGRLFQEGETMFMPELAETLRVVAEKGAEELYRGELAKKLIADIESFGGIITLKDLEIYQPVVRDAVSFALNDTRLYSVPPPGSGLLLGFALQLLDGFHLDGETVDDQVLTNHIFLEAMKFAYAKRPQIADPQFSNMANLTTLLTSSDFVKHIREAIDKSRTYDPSRYESLFAAHADHGTAHVSVLAPNGDAVSMTSTINHYFGACLRSMSTGIILNNEMDDFARLGTANFYGVPPDENNFIAAGKRPASSMSPAIILDKDDNVRYVIGSSGGIRIISTTAYTYMLHDMLGEDVSAAVTNPRVYHQLYPNIVEYEKDFSQPILDGLKLKGHRLEPVGTVTAASLIYRDDSGDIIAGSDPRRRSRPAGF